MKKHILTILLALFSIISFANPQADDDDPEISAPSYGIEFDRKVAWAIIEGKEYENVIVDIKVADIGDVLTGVRVVVKDVDTDKIIYKKRFSRSYLYGFSGGRIAIGRGNILTQMRLYRNEETGSWVMELRKKGLDWE